jgi:hypothetical protein
MRFISDQGLITLGQLMVLFVRVHSALTSCHITIQTLFLEPMVTQPRN